MIGVPVTDDHVIDGLEAGQFGGDLVNAFRIAVARIAAIDQHRLPGRRHEQSGSTALGVDKVDVQPTASLLGVNGSGEQQGEYASEECGTHWGSLRVRNRDVSGMIGEHAGECNEKKKAIP